MMKKTRSASVPDLMRLVEKSGVSTKVNRHQAAP
jgi:hypothetical protein